MDRVEKGEQTGKPSCGMSKEARRQCYQKIKYKKKSSAKKAAKAMRMKHHEPFTFYVCLFCGFYHVGHKISKERAEFLMETLL